MRCLNNVENILKNKKTQIAGLAVEPILAEGGDLCASNEWYKNLRNLCADYDISFIADEVQTNMGSTGKFWAHEHWGLDNPPDIVT